MDTAVAQELGAQTGATYPLVFVTAIGAAVTALASVALAFIAWRGLVSIRLAQKDMVDRATREATDTAIDRCLEFGTELIELHGDILKSFTDIEVFVNDPAVGFGGKKEVEARERAAQWVAELSSELYGDCVRLLNRLEAWSMYFTKALADGKVAYGPCAPVYVAMVIQLYPLVVHVRALHQSGRFPKPRRAIRDLARADAGREGRRAT